MSEADNLRRWPAERRGVYEVWYTTWNDPATGQGFWLRFILETPSPGGGVPPYGEAARGELWFARFDPRDPARTFGIHKRFASELVASRDAPFEISIAGRTLSNAHSTGDLAGAGHEVRWDLRWIPSPTSLRFYSDALYAGGGLASSMALAPNTAVPIAGSLVVDGEQITFDRVLATQSHVWGTKHALAWTWAHGHEFEGAPGAVLELVGGRLQRRGVTLPALSGVAMVLDGETIRLNQLRHLIGNRAQWGVGRVTFRAGSTTVRVEGELSCRPEDMVNAPYVDPDGQALWCANTEIADANITVFRRRGLRWREDRKLVARGTMHFEVGSRERDPSVTTPHAMVS